MQDIYEKYYWQNDKVRLRAVRPEDDSYAEKLDSEAWAMASQEMTLPPVKKERAAISEKEIDSETIQDGNRLFFSVENLEGDYIGHIQLVDINERHGTFELGISIWRNYRNKGYAKAAVKILLEYAFNEKRLNKCSVDCIDCNNASISLWKSLGFQQEGIVREEFFFNGAFHDRLLFGLTANEYNLKRTK